MINVSDKKNVVEKIETRILCSTNFFFDNRAIYEIMWEDTVQPDRLKMTVLTHAYCILDT